MVTTESIASTLIQYSVVNAVKSVSRAMFQEEAVWDENPAPKLANGSLVDLGPGPYVMGCVGFAGESKGLVCLCFTEKFARHTAAGLLKITPAEVDARGPEMLKDVIGEVTNVTTGTFTKALSDYGYTCTISLPTIIRGDFLSIAAIKAATRSIFHFTCGDFHLMVDVQVKM